MMQTNVPHIYAIGDVTGGIMLAHAATWHGIRALNHICGNENDGIRLDVIPGAVFTVPEVATVGLTEDECKDKGIDYRCGKAFFRANGKALCMNEPDGLCKVIADADGKLLGCHLYGPHAADLVQEVCALISTGATVDQLKRIIHTHPTLGEVVQTAAHTM
jgi:dihydrolipoamide dehydrogenase